LKSALAEQAATLDQARTDLKAVGGRADRAEAAREQAYQEAEAARAETSRVREEFTVQAQALQRVRDQRDEARTAAAVATAQLGTLQQALEQADHRATAAEQREATAQQTISRLLASQAGEAHPPQQSQTMTAPQG
jgi:chromosome segregation ATPase